MSTDLHQQLARFAQALDQDAPTISYDDVVDRGTVAIEVELAGRSPRDPDEIDEHVLIELAPTVAARRPAWRRVGLTVALGVAAAVVVFVAFAVIERDSDDRAPVVDLPSFTTTFVSPRNGFTLDLPEGADITPATQLWAWSGKHDDGYDVVKLGSGAVFRGASTDLSWRSIGLSVDERADEYLLSEYVLPDACGVPRSQQAEITIDGRSGRIAECSDHIEATVVVQSQVQEDPGFTAGRLYLFTLSDGGSEARAVFDAVVDTIDLTPHTANDVPADTVESPTYGYSFPWIRGHVNPATERWDPGGQPVDDIYWDPRFDGFETGSFAYFEAASTPVPDGVSIDDWVGERVTALAAGGCGLPRSQQTEITIDGRSGWRGECHNQIEVTVVAGGRLYLFRGSGFNGALIDAWIDSIDLTPETAVDL